MAIELLAHRGAWTAPHERNTAGALDAAFTCGWGVETDLRDLAGRVAVSHDPPPAAHELFLDDLVALWSACPSAGRLALNVKADGLQRLVTAAVPPEVLARSFVFDASVPDERVWLRSTPVAVFVRHSELEPSPCASPHYALARGVWLDAFDGQWWDAATVRRHLDAGKEVAVVSPELHGREHLPAWEVLVDGGLWGAPGVLLCTDLPAAAAAVDATHG